jgi:hypothetical protein
MDPIRIKSAADAVAVAVLLARHLPTSELVILPNGQGAPMGAVPLPGEPDAADVDVLAATLRDFPGIEEPLTRAFVVFGTESQAVVVAEAIMRVIDPSALSPVFAYFQGQAVQWDGFSAAIGEPVDLATHPHVARGLIDGTVSLLTRRELFAVCRPAQFGSARSEAVADKVAQLLREWSADEPTAVAKAVHAEAIEPQLSAGDHGIYVSEGQAALLVAAVSGDLRIRDALMGQFTEENARAIAEVWRQAGASVPADLSGNAMVLSALARWIVGDAVPAREALNAALESTPNHSFGRLLERVLDAGVNPRMVWPQIRAGLEFE